jgi:ribosomal protein S18 acetylase RimI-like enzyme
MMLQNMETLRRMGVPGVHLGVSVLNTPAMPFYERLGFRELKRVGTPTDGCVYMGRSLQT